MRVSRLIVFSAVLLAPLGCNVKPQATAVAGIDARAIESLFVELRSDERRDINGVLG